MRGVACSPDDSPNGLLCLAVRLCGSLRLGLLATVVNWANYL
jgi:hypothetical protein